MCVCEVAQCVPSSPLIHLNGFIYILCKHAGVRYVFFNIGNPGNAILIHHLLSWVECDILVIEIESLEN